LPAPTSRAAGRRGKPRLYERAAHRKGIGAIQQAPDAVQNVESDSLTEGYKSKFPLFHKLFLSGVEKVGGIARYWADVRSGNNRVIGPSGHQVLEIQRRSSLELR
jgi:hypothetical protein